MGSVWKQGRRVDTRRRQRIAVRQDYADDNVFPRGGFQNADLEFVLFGYGQRVLIVFFVELAEFTRKPIGGDVGEQKVDWY